MYNNISFGADFRKAPVFQMSKRDFEINPLDVNIAKMQFNLLNRLEREMPENGDFAPVVEEYQSKDPTIGLSKIKTVCKFIKDNSTKKETRALELTVTDKKDGKEKAKTLCQGNKKEILDYLNSKKYFEICKNLASKA